MLETMWPVAHPSSIFFLTARYGGMIPLQYVKVEGLLLLFRVAAPFGFKGSGF
jgi:hypothetical protein